MKQAQQRVGRSAPQPAAEADRRELGTRLKEAREYLDLSQDEVARVLHVPRSAISMMETGQRKVDAVELKKLAAMYQLPMAHLTGEEASPPLPETVQHLARAATKLTEGDREELLRFAEFLQAKGTSQ